MKPCAVYIIGGSGVGKSTLMGELLQGWVPGEYVRLTQREMFGHWLAHTVLGDGVYLGKLRPEFPGTDALSLSVNPHAVTWVTEQMEAARLSWVFGEGTRLGNIRFLSALAGHARLTVVHLTLDPEIARLRRSERGGKQMTDQFVKITSSSAESAAQACREAGIQVLELDGQNFLADLVAQVHGSVVP
jgi:GTPase SAR1 family protein